MNIKYLNDSMLRKGLVFSAIFFLILSLACRDEGALTPEFNTSGIGVEEDSLTVVSETTYGDSVRTDRVSRMLVGKLNDMTYGYTESDFYAQLNLSSSSFDTPEDVTQFDSIILYLSYSEFYGFNGESEIFIYELDEDLLTDAEYYNTSSAAYNEDTIGYGKLTLDTADTTAGILRIKLSQSIADRIYEQGEFVDNEAWLNFFRGIRVSSDQQANPTGDGEGAILYFDVSDADSKMELHFTTDGEASTYDFIFESQQMFFSSFRNDYSQSSIPGIIGDQTLEINHLTSLAGLRTKFTINIPDELLNSPRPLAINKAELIIPFDEPTYSSYGVADRLVLIQRDEADESWILPVDFDRSGQDYFDGTLRVSTKEYRFNIASTVSKMINEGQSDLELYISVSGNSVAAYRMNIFSGKGNSRKIYLLLTYSNP